MAQATVQLVFGGGNSFKGKDKVTQRNKVTLIEVDEDRQGKSIEVWFDNMPSIVKTLVFGDVVECRTESYSALQKARITEIIRKVSSSTFNFSTSA